MLSASGGREAGTIARTSPVALGARHRRVLTVRGTVQGVGFRPFVYRTAVALGLAGSVRNDAEGVVVDAQGPLPDLDRLGEAIHTHAPARAVVESILVADAAPDLTEGFLILQSERAEPASARVCPDIATCPRCLAEMADARDRRHRYPFINCTDCGPRVSIARDVPYDRPNTTMRAFTMCARCAGEYADPVDRRFHAQPQACPACGPKLSFVPDAGGDPLAAALAALARGAIVAVKGLGGFHLACDATRPDAVRTLRARKRREARPFAVMFPDLAAVEREAVVDEPARRELASWRRPIVLLRRRPGSRLAPDVAPGLAEIGALLPYTPLHHLLLEGARVPLVMTSGNLTDEPIASGNDEARARLAPLADAFLVHDRDIQMRLDDSVVRVMLGSARVLRRSRGHVPEAIRLPVPAPPLLAVGGDMKNAFALSAGDAAILGPHVGDLESHDSQRFFEEARARLATLFRVRPTAVVHDLHPGYHSTELARRTGLPALAVQHHHAHVASCLVDNDRADRVIGVAFDGAGYGPDGTVWGGEFLVADLAGSTRFARIAPMPLAGGDAAAREPWRMAFACRLGAGLPVEAASPAERAVLAMLRSGSGTVITSSAGRLFDAVASLAGVCDRVTYEGQAAMELEAIGGDDAEPYPLPVVEGPLLELDWRPLVRAVVADRAAGVPASRIGARFHAALAEGIADVAGRVRARTGLATVALSGGCFANVTLTTLAWRHLRRRGFEVLTHRRVPPGDGGLALGQLAVAAWRQTHVSGDPR